jgi:tetratricopeptide (TPR) repeat protein
MLRKVGLLACLAVAIGAESVYFARHAIAGILRLRGERAFFSNDHLAAWNCYRRALVLGGDRERLETDQAQLLLFGLDQSWAGVNVRTAFPHDEAVRITIELLRRRILETPYKAYDWSLASDAYFHAARLRRQKTPLDLSLLTDNPLDILMPEDRLGLAALETASRLEPTNYVYHDLLVEKLIDLQSVARAAVYCRRSLAANPVLSDHPYLLRPDIDPQIFEAALQGFDDSRKETSLVPPAAVDSDEGEFLRRNGQPEKAIEFLKHAVALDPRLFDAQYGLGMAYYSLAHYDDALRHLRKASACLPDSSGPYVFMGLSYMALKDLPAAIDQFRTAREKDPRGLWIFHFLGEALEKSGQVSEAERQFVAGANVNPDRAEAWAALLGFYTRHRDLRPFPEVCSRLLGLDPESDLYRQQCASLGLEIR